MSLRRTITGLAVLGALAATARTYAARRRAIAAVPDELRAPILYFPTNITNPLILALIRRIPIPEPPTRPGIRVERRTVHGLNDDPPVDVVVYDRPGRTGARLDALRKAWRR